MDAKEATFHLHAQALGAVTDWEVPIVPDPSGPVSLEMASAQDSRSLNPVWGGGF